MKIIQNELKHLNLYMIPLKEDLKKDGTVLILGNAYGIMPYQEPLAKALAEKNIEPWWFAFSGQEGNAGTYSGTTGLQNLNEALEYLSYYKGDRPLWIIAHCAGSLIALEYLKNNPYTDIEKLIIYGLLFNPQRRREFAQKKFVECGVNASVTKADWNYNPLHAIASVQIPILFCHARDKLNLFRAKEEEMKEALVVAKNADIVWFEKGYDNDIEILSAYVDRYYSFLTSSMLETAVAKGI